MTFTIPGTYLAGGYNRLRTDIAGRVVENEDLVNFPNWLALEFRIADGDWFDPRTVTLLSYRQELDLRRGMLLRTIRFEDGQGRRTTLKERRLVSMSDMHLGALELALTAENWSASVTVRSAIDGRVVNAGAKLYRTFNNTHLEPLAGEVVGEDGVYLLVRTCQSHLHVAQAARTQAFVDGQLREARARSSTNRDTSGRSWTSTSARRDAGAGEARLVLYVAGSGHLGARPGGAQGDGARGSLRGGDGGACPCLEAPVAPLRRAPAAGRVPGSS